MAKKKKKKVADKLAKKRGQRTAQSRLKRKKAPKVSKKTSDLSAEQRQAAEVALLRSPLLLSSPELEPVHLDGDRVTEYLEDMLAPETSLHGCLVDVYGVGIFIIGKSGIGKSESALELISRGFRFISDDVTQFERNAKGKIVSLSNISYI